MHLCFIFVETSAVYDHVCFQFGVPAFIPTEKYGPAQASQPSALPHVQPPNRLYARYTATSIPFQYINPSFFCKIKLLCPHILLSFGGALVLWPRSCSCISGRHLEFVRNGKAKACGMLMQAPPVTTFRPRYTLFCEYAVWIPYGQAVLLQGS